MEYSKVLNEISTVYELRQLMGAIDSIRTELYKTDQTAYDQVFYKNVSVHLVQVLREELPKEREAQAEYLGGLREALDNMPVVTLVTAFYPSEGFLSELSQRLKELMETSVVVDIRVSRLLLGGARIEYRGKVCDYSVRYRLTKILESHSDQIASWGKDD